MRIILGDRSVFVESLMKQTKLMLDFTRIFAVLSVVLSSLLCYIMAFENVGGTPALVFLIVELFAYFWYTLSYVPNGYEKVWATVSYLF